MPGLLKPTLSLDSGVVSSTKSSDYKVAEMATSMLVTDVGDS